MRQAQVISIVCGLILGLAAIFGDQVDKDVIHLPPEAKPYVAFGVVFLGTTLIPSVKKWEGAE